MPDRPSFGSRRAVFLDRDGVINRALTREGQPYPPHSLEEFEILPGVEEACRELKRAGFILVVATNQPDVARGTLAKETVQAIHAHMCRLLPIDHVETCFHGGHESPPCACRKPLPGMLLMAARQLNIDLSRSFMVGDRWRDIDCGHAVGSATLLVDYQYDEPLRTPPDYRVRGLSEAAEIILGQSRPTGLH